MPDNHETRSWDGEKTEAVYQLSEVVIALSNGFPKYGKSRKNKADATLWKVTRCNECEAQTVHVKLASEELAKKEDTLVDDGYQWYAFPKFEWSWTHILIKED